MLTVPEAAKLIGRNPETVRRWIREGKLRARKVGSQHVIEEQDLEPILNGDTLPAPPEWDVMFNGQRAPNWERIVRALRL